MYKNIIKPICDISAALIAFTILLPLFLLVVILLAISNKGTPFYLQVRPGLNCRPFKILKFKTMNDDRDEEGNLLPDDRRITLIGHYIRKFSIDEIPQLINVILGQMSIVGPRPLLMDYLDLYDINQIKRQYVKPGITGWAQVNGRNAISWNKKFELDEWYTDNISFIIDIKILFLTVIKVLKREGISSENSQTMEKFTGNN